MIPSDSVARRAIFDALRPDIDDVSWELVSSGGEKLHVATPEQLALNSSDHFLQLARPEVADGMSTATSAAAPPETTTTAAPTPQPTPSSASQPPAHYRVHELEPKNRSLSDRDAREKLWQLLSLLADVIDPSSGTDIQVATIKVELNAAEGSLDEVGTKAEQAGAAWETYEEDF